MTDSDTDLMTLACEGDVLRVSGEVDISNAAELDEAIERRLGSQDVRLDLSETEFIDSSGLRVLLAHHQFIDEQTRRIVIVRPSAAVLRVVQLSGLDGYLHIEYD